VPLAHSWQAIRSLVTSKHQGENVKLHRKIRALAVTAVTVGVISGGMLTAEAASAAPYHGGVLTARATPDVVFYCGGNLCAGWEGAAANPTIAAYAAAASFKGHYEVQTPNHKTFNDADGPKGAGAGNQFFFRNMAGGKGEYCVTDWQRLNNGTYNKIGYVCFAT
jgi:hypothetical protein